MAVSARYLSLVSRLRRRTACYGSTLYALTWKVRVTPSGRSIYALRASSGHSGRTSWPTPNVASGDETVEQWMQRRGNDKKMPQPPLVVVAQLATWHTPQAQEPGISIEKLQTKDGEPYRAGERAYHKETGRLAQQGVSQEVQLTSWSTPASRDGKDCSDPATWTCKEQRDRYDQLPRQAQLAAWPTPRVADDNLSRFDNPQEKSLKELMRPNSGSNLAVTAQALAPWPTPQASDNIEGSRTAEDSRQACLGRDVKKIASWPTPNTMDSMPSKNLEERRKNGGCFNLKDVVQENLSSWPTPTCQEAKHGIPSPAQVNRSSLDAVAHRNLSTWPTPSAEGSAGEISEDLERRGAKWVNRETGRVLQTNLATDAKMLTQDSQTSEGRGQLNPAFSRWLMGLPSIFDDCAPSEVRRRAK